METGARLLAWLFGRANSAVLFMDSAGEFSGGRRQQSARRYDFTRHKHRTSICRRTILHVVPGWVVHRAARRCRDGRSGWAAATCVVVAFRRLFDLHGAATLPLGK